MQVHLDADRITDPDVAYAWAAIAQCFITKDPRYAIGALLDIDTCDSTCLQILFDIGIW